MDDLTLRYYDAEMRYLLEAGEEFARAHPEQAAMLNLDKAGARDPYVERLFEGFAFLMGRLREKLDDDLPELTEGLVSLLWPHYLRTIPSMSVVEFTPVWREMKEPMRIARGFEVNSRPIGEKGTRCRYTTTKEITLQPLALEHARLSTDPDGRSVISLRFSCSHLADWSRVDLSQIPFYFNADAPLACAMHEAFTMNTARLWLRMPGDMDRRPMDGYFTALGFGDDDRLWPKGDSSFSGYQLLLEYFTFREKFMFTGLRGLESVVFPAEMMKMMTAGHHLPVKQWKPFAAGMLFMLVAAGIVAVGWQTMHAPDSAQMQLAATLAPLPEGLSTAQLQALQQTSPPPEPGISKTQQLLAQLLHLKPDWAVSYGDRLVQQALTLWPEEAKPLAQQWHKQISVAGLAESDLNGWHQGMTQLQQLTNRLNALDEQKGKYMTVSELKSAVFAMSQSFSHTVPLEEQLRLLSILPAGQPVSAAQLNQTEQHLQQLIANYALLKHQKE